jgi:hypothetical protein
VVRALKLARTGFGACIASATASRRLQFGRIVTLQLRAGNRRATAASARATGRAA